MMPPQPSQFRWQQLSYKSQSEGETIMLRSMNDLKGFDILATDGEISHVEDFILDDDSWVIRYLVIDTRKWLPGKKVLVSPRCIGRKAKCMSISRVRE